ncbi:hypothetical protein WICPIJ_007441 [Wickerhamomyces pijperi]|uniref:Protein kinase domain-containing protein n=1 Tax=Wickerhamomyces pijperi TaxID=599730 RepID=A0A9P8Q1S0_WICPI|nr:hypothetical protein WICPIJ_007441 [Wickerhamomyces pijperi]
MKFSLSFSKKSTQLSRATEKSTNPTTLGQDITNSCITFDTNDVLPKDNFDLVTKFHMDQWFSVDIPIGRGSFGIVYLVAPTQGNNHIINPEKYCRPKGSLMERFAQESVENVRMNNNGNMAIKALRLLKHGHFWSLRDVDFILNTPYHPNLLHIYEMFVMPSETETDEYTAYIVMECMELTLAYFFPTPSNNKILRPLQLKSVLRQLLQAISHMHKSGFIHRDVKPNNIMLTPTADYYSKEAGCPHPELVSFDDQYVVKLVDYGLAKPISEALKTGPTIAGTRTYMAPEILLQYKTDGTAADIWSFGCVMYQMIVGEEMIQCNEGPNDVIYSMVDLLGTPFMPKNSKVSKFYEPGFGYWNKAQELMEAKGVKFEKQHTVPHVEEVFGRSYLCANPEFMALMDVAKLCLQWDPSARATADELLQMPYFTETSALSLH